MLFFTFIIGTPFGRKDQIRAKRERPYREILWPYRHETQGTGTRPAQGLILTALSHGKVFSAWPTDGNDTSAKLKDLTGDLTRYQFLTAMVSNKNM